MSAIDAQLSQKMRSKAVQNDCLQVKSFVASLVYLKTSQIVFSILPTLFSYLSSKETRLAKSSNATHSQSKEFDVIITTEKLFLDHTF